MLLIECPWCGARDEIEFAYGGEAARPRPADPAAHDDDSWAAHLFMRRNPKGEHHERWNHATGCRRWFNVRRSTVTHAIEVERDVSGGASVIGGGRGEPGAAGGAE